MSRARHYRLMVNVVLMALLFGTSPRHTGDPRDHAFNPNLFGANEASGEGLDGEFLDAPPFQRDLFQAATELNRSLHERSQESRTATDYRRTMDAYDKVTRMGADEGLAARSLAQGGDLMREMADAAGHYKSAQPWRHPGTFLLQLCKRNGSVTIPTRRISPPK